MCKIEKDCNLQKFEEFRLNFSKQSVDGGGGGVREVGEGRGRHLLQSNRNIDVTCKRGSSNRRYGHKEELHTNTSGYLVDANDVSTQDSQEYHVTTIKHTKNNHVNNEACITLGQRTQSIRHADDQHRYLETVESVHSRVVAEFAEEEPAESRAHRHHADQCGRLRIRYAAFFSVGRLLKK